MHHLAWPRAIVLGIMLSLALPFGVACTDDDDQVRATVPPPPTPVQFPSTPTAITLPPTPTPITFPPTPTAITFPPTPTAISLPPTPTAMSLPSTPTAMSLPPTPTPVGSSDGENESSALATADIVQRVTPSVVQIQVVTPSGRGSGTGVILDEQGRILTNQHVIASARQIGVALTDDRVFEAELVGEDPTVDIAVLKIEAEHLTPADFGDSPKVRVGEEVIAIGHALGLSGGPTVSKGIVSALGRSLQGNGDTLSDLIQTDAAINPGNSGGPLVNAKGEVIGINTAKIRAGEGIGFAIEGEVALQVAERLIEESALPPGYLGISGINITPALAQIAGLPVSRGVGIVELQPGGPADGAGIEVDDIIVQMNDFPIRDLTDLSRFLRRNRAGESVTVTLVRDQRVRRIQISLGSPPEG